MGGKGSTLKAGGEEYIDFICGLGTNLFGYGNPQICGAVAKAISYGISHSLPTRWEGEAAEALSVLFPWVEKYKFLCTGSEACSAAIRMARAYTGRLRVLSEAYHGWHDSFVSLTPPATGIPPHSHIDKLLPDLTNIDGTVAAVIVEPIITDCSNDRVAWLRALATHCKHHGAVLIFDEVITGLRYLNHSVSKSYNIKPDLICLGKAIGSGLPLAAVAGRADILDGPYFVSSTNAGSVAGLAACIAAVKLLTGSVDYKVERLWKSGEYFMNQFNELHPQLRIEGYPTRGVFAGGADVKALFFQEACRAGVLFGPSWFFNFDHVKDMDMVLDISRAILDRIKRGEVELEGQAPVSPFAEKVRKR